MFAAPVQETVDEPFNEPMAPPEEPLTPKRRSSVQLMGFVDVDHPMALLNVAGEIEMLSVGDVCCDIRVTAIEPPTVRIQRLPGSHDAEETISLFDRTWDEAAVWANPHPGKHASPPRRQSASVSSTVAGDTSLTRVPRSTAPIDLVEMITTPVVTAAPLPVIEAIPGLALPGMTVFERDAAGGK